MKKVLNFEGAVKVDYPEDGGLIIGGVSMDAVRTFLEREFATKEEQSVIYGCGTPVQWRVRVTIEAERL